MSFVGGKLKLKGGETLKSSGGVKKKKKDSAPSTALAAPGAGDQGGKPAEDDKEAKTQRAIHGYALEQNPNADRRTDTQKKFEERFKKVEEERLKKLAVKSHRDRIKEFNDYLGNLSEHHGALRCPLTRLR